MKKKYLAAILGIMMATASVTACGAATTETTTNTAESSDNKGTEDTTAESAESTDVNVRIPKTLPLLVRLPRTSLEKLS